MSLNIKLNNIPEIKQSEQFPYREDIIQFSHDMVKSARNKFRKRNHVGSNHDISTQLTSQNRSIRNKRTIHQQKQQGCQTDRQNRGQANIHQLFRQSEISKRISITSNNNYRQRRSSSSTNNHKISKTQSMQIDGLLNYTTPVFDAKKPFTPFTTDRVTETNNIKNEQSAQMFTTFNQALKNNFESIQKKHNKSRLKDCTIPSWLNDILIEASKNTQIKKQENSGLKEFSIDRSSLLRKGIHVQHINRLYQSLYVYSVGFNDLLKQICNRNNELRQTIWKVYAILLEFCSGGNFQTMIGQIQRDKQTKLLQFRGQIEKRQRIIQQNDQINEKKNLKLLKEVRQLQQANKDLQAQKLLIMQQFREAQQSFNQQISLRLKYETKINHIHGIYEQLKQKYSMLKEQDDKNLRTIHQHQQTIIKLNSKISEMTLHTNQLLVQIQNLTIHNGQLQQNLKQLQRVSKTQGVNYITIKSQSQSYISIIAEKNRKIQQLQLRAKNLQASQKSLMKTYQNRNDEFEKAMLENSKLTQQLQNQFQTINQLAIQKRQIGLKATQIAALLGIQTRKTQLKQQQLRQTKSTLDNIKQQLNLKEVDLIVQKQKTNSLAHDLQLCYHNIKQMKQKQSQSTTQLSQFQKKTIMLSEALANKKIQQQKMLHELQDSKKQINTLKIQIKQKQSKITIIQDKYRMQSQVWNKKISQIIKQRDNMAFKCEKAQKQREGMFEQMIRAKERYEQMYMDLKNEKFQRTSLDLYYKQSLAVVQEQIEHIKKLDMQISQLKQALQQNGRKYNTLQLIHKHKTELLQKDVVFWKQSSFTMEKRAKQKKYYIHPMIFEDFCEKNRILEEQKIKFIDTIAIKDRRIKQLQNERNMLLQQCKIIEKKTTEGSHRLYKSQITKRDKQISFLKQKVQYQTSKLAQAQVQVAKAKNQMNQAIDVLRKQQTQFMRKINEKNFQLNQLNNKYRSVISLNQNQLEQSSKISTKYQRQRNELRMLVEQLTSKVKNYQVMIQKQRLLSKQRQKIIHKRNNHENKEENEVNQVETQKPKIKRYDQNGNLQQDEELEHLSSKQQLRIKKQKNSQKIAQQPTKEEEALKRRQDIRKKIKGAYLYYKK